MKILSKERINNFVDKSEIYFREYFRRRYLRKAVVNNSNYRKVLTKEQLKECKKYWSKYTNHFSPVWHELFTAIIGEFDVRYVPEDIQFTDIEKRINDWKAAYGIDDKNNYSMYFSDVKHPKTIFRKMRGIYHNENYEIISKDQAIENCINCGDVIFKIAKLCGLGDGIYFWKTSDGIEKLIDLFNSFPEEINSQEYIYEHDALAKMAPNSCNTIRVLTYSNDKEVVVLKSYYQVAMNNEVRMGQVSVGGVCCSIHEDGTLYEKAYDAKYNSYTKHPCGIEFKGYKIPNYKEVCEAAIKCHKKMGHFRIISWDFTVDKEGNPVFIEMNINYGGIMYHQLSSGPLYGDGTEQLLQEIYK